MAIECCVGIVDDEPGMRLLLSRLLEAEGFAVRCYDCAESMLRDDEELQFGCIVLDVSLTGMTGLQFLSDLRLRGSDVPIVMVSGQASVSDTIAAFKNKASAFFEKPFNNQELVQTVRELITDWSIEKKRCMDLRAKLANLSSREQEVLEALVAGKKTRQIALEMAISASTVEKHRLNIFKKTKVDSVIGLVHLVAE